MWMDIAVLVVVLGSTITGYVQGFTRTFLHTIGWLLAIILGFVWYPALTEFLREKTDFYGTMHNSVAEQLTLKGFEAAGNPSDIEGLFSSIPDILKQVFEATSEVIADSLASGITDILFNIVGFILIILAIKFIFWLLISLFSKRSNDGLTGWFDGIFGAVFGGFKGIIIVFILLAILVPVTELSSGTFFLDQLEASKLAAALYNNNMVFLIVKEFL